MSISRQEITNIRKSALHTVTLSSEMKTSIVDAKLRELNAEIKKVLAKNGMTIEIFVTTTASM